MNRVPRCVLGLTSCLLLASVVAAWDLHFVQKVNAGGQNIETESWMSGKKMKIAVNTPMGQTEMIFDPAAGKVVTLMVASKSYLEMPLSLIKQQAAAAQQTLGDVKIEKTGKTQTINGWSCAEYKITSSGSVDLSVWATRDLKIDLKGWQDMSRELSQDAISKAIDPSKIDGFPVRTEGTVRQGGQELKVMSEVTKVDTNPLSPDLFNVPSDYKKMDAGNPFATPPPQSK